MLRQLRQPHQKARRWPPGSSPRSTSTSWQQLATEAASSSEPLIRAQAPARQAYAQQAANQLDRQQRLQETLGQRRQHDTERAQDRQDNLAWRGQQAEQARAARNPMLHDFQDGDGKVGTYQVNPDGSRTRLGDAANQPGPAAPPTGYLWTDASHTAMQRIPNGPADDREARAAAAAAAKEAARYQHAPDGYRWTDENHTALEKIPGGQADKPDKLPSDGVTKGILGNMSSLRQLDQAIAVVQAHPEAFGAGQGNSAVQWVESSMPQGLGGSPQTSINARGQVANIGSLKLHERSGANVTATEHPRLAPFVPAPGDDAQTVKTKLENMRLIVQENLQDQYDTYGPAAGYRLIPGHARALGLEDTTQTPKVGPGVPAGGKGGKGGGSDEVPASMPGQTAPAPPAAPAPAPAAGADRRRAAVEQARSMLPPDASNEAIIAKAQELLGR
jgi:hypothetical protein